MPPGGPPSWGGPPQSGGYGGPPKKSNNTLWIVLGLGGVAVVVLLVVMLSGGGGSSSTSSPDGAVRGLLEAVIDGDCQRAGEFITSNFPGGCPEEVPFTSLESVETVSEEGSNASVQATVSDEQGTQDTFDFTVVEADGEWKVDNVDVGAGGSSSSGGGESVEVPDVPEVEIPSG
jgi:hypothetical protein